MSNSQVNNNVNTSYLLWLGYFFGLAGLHRIYNRKIGTGILWLCTFGVFGIGQLVDLVLIPRLVDEYNTKARAKLGLSPTGMPLSQGAIAATVVKPTRDELMVKILKAASARGGKLSVTQAVMDTGADFTDVEAILKEMLQVGYVRLDNHPDSGVVIYDFVEL
jgi:TM2 domain-containing membrane protein YozV/predicted transcriptional regulator